MELYEDKRQNTCNNCGELGVLIETKHTEHVLCKNPECVLVVCPT